MRAKGWRAALLTCVSLAAAADARAQARPFPSGVGSVSLAFQRIDNTGHRLSDGFLLPEGESVNQGLALDVGYGLTGRLSVSAGIPYIGAKYTGAGPTPILFRPVDSGRNWHSSLQDFTLGLRYNALARGPLAITPGLGVVLPSHAYTYQGEAVVGRRLRELHLALNVARTLDEISEDLEISAHYTYALVEEAKVDAHVPNNRSNASLEIGYSVTPRLQVLGAAHWQRTHGGLKYGEGPQGTLSLPGEVNTPDRFAEHDRLLRDNSVHLEGGLAYSVGAVDLFANYRAYVSGTDTHAGRALTLGATWFFGGLPAPSSR